MILYYSGQEVDTCSIAAYFWKISERHHEEIFTVGRTLGGTHNHTFCLEEKWPDVKLFADSWAIVNGLDK